MRAMFTHDASLQVLVWTLGGHLKAFLGFWPHLVLQARKGAGKSTLLQGLGRLTGMTTFGGQSLGTEFRILTSISHTVHPIAWEELSSRGMVIIEKAVSMLQEAYTATVTRRNADMVPYLICAPVLLAGEDVPVKSLIGKLVRVDLSGRKNELLPDNLPPFPLKEWCQFLARQRREEVKDIHTKWRSYFKQSCSAIDNDDGAARMIGNYAALLTAWMMLQRFAEVPDDGETMARLVVAEMNRHIMETRAEREPWVWVLETFLNELDSGMFKLHAVVDDYKGKRCLLVRPSSIYHHISSNANLRSFYDALPIKSHRIFKKQMDDAGVVVSDRVEKAFKGVRIGGLCALDIDRLREFGLDVTDPGVESAPPRDFHDVN